MGPRPTLSMDNDFDPAGNVNVFSSILVRLYRARLPLLSVELLVNNMAGLGLTHLTCNWEFKNLKMVLETTLLFIR